MRQEPIPALRVAAAALGPVQAPRSLRRWLHSMTRHTKQHPVATARDVAYLVLAALTIGTTAVVVGELRAEHRQHGVDIERLRKMQEDAAHQVQTLATSTAELVQIVKGHTDGMARLDGRLDRMETRRP